MKIVAVLAILLCISTYGTSAEVDVEKIRQKLEKLLHEKNIPPEVSKWIAVLHDSVDILKCAPTIKSGNCYRSLPCTVPKLKVDKYIIRIVLSVCKNPWKIRIEFLPLDLPWYAKLILHPMDINFNNDERSGIFTIKSDTTIKLQVRHVHFNVAKANFMIDGSIRYDCTKPRGGTNWMERAVSNMDAPDRKYNKVFYHLKIRMELKKKHFNWGKFNYKCVKCVDLINKSGVFGNGPASCVAEVNKYIPHERNVINRYKQMCPGGFWRVLRCLPQCQREKQIPPRRCNLMMD